MTQQPDKQPRIRLLILDEDDDVIESLRGLPAAETLSALELSHARTLADAKAAIDQDGIDLIGVDVHGAGITKLDLLPVLNELAPDLPLVVWLPEVDRETAMRVIRLGAQDCLNKEKLADLDAYWLIRSFEYAIDRKRAEREKRRMEEQLWESQKMESLGVLAGGVAHDFNNLLCGIMGNASLARETVPESSTAGDCLLDIERVSERATALCRQMLAYAGGQQAMAEEFDLNDLVSQKPELLKTSVSKEARLKAELSPRSLVVNGDRSQVGQVIVNLVINASDALNGLPGEITLKTSLEDVGVEFFSDTVLQPKLPPGAYNCLTVTDSGTGMDRSTRERIFEPFFTTKFIGRGMGLPAALGIVRSHGGGDQD
jgi:signal transduction histidine kinase